MLVVDAGGMTHPNKQQNPLYNDFVAEAMNTMRYDAVTMGQLELDRGADFVRAYAPKFQCPVVVSNVRVTSGETPWKETAVVQIGGRKVGILGLVSADYGQGPDALIEAGFTFEEPLAATRRLLPGLRKQCDVVVALAHLATKDIDDVLRAGRGIDLVVAGYNPNPVNAQPDTAVTTILRPGQRGEHVGIAHVMPGVGGAPATVSGLETVMLEMAKYPDDEALAARLAAIKKEVEAETRKAQLEQELKAQEGLVLGQDRYLGGETCARCHAREAAWWNGNAHARAYATLETKGKQADPACLKCHVTGDGMAGGFGGTATTVDMKNVQCESCHGMGTQHDWSGASAARVGEAACRTCHTAEWSPDFDYGTYFGRLGHGKK
jgi:hypothetical protein